MVLVGGGRGAVQLAGADLQGVSALDDPGADLVHAWIGRNGNWFIANCSGDHPLLVNGEPIKGRRALASGDHIEVGQRTRITFLD